MKKESRSSAPLLIHAQAPGRVNLIGEHTDYNGGYVLPLALPLKAQVAGVLRNDDWVYATSSEMEDGTTQIHYRLGQEKPAHQWTDYIQGLTWILRKEGHRFGGFEIFITSTVPLGSGLSSSAALEVSVLRFLRELFSFELDDTALALLAHRAETEFVGAKVGIMDQMVSSLGGTKNALFLHTRSLKYERVPLPPKATWVVINSGVAHSHAGGDYNQRRHECEEAARLLGIRSLSDFGVKDLDRITKLPDPLFRRVRHVLTENQRVLETVAAFRRGDLLRIGQLFHESHASMRDDYEVSIPEIDFLVDTLKKDERVYGSRLTGGGFGGCIVVLTEKGEGWKAAQKTARLYDEEWGRKADILLAFDS